MIVMVDSLKKKLLQEKQSVPLVEKTQKPTDGIEPEVVQDTSIAVQEKPVQEAVPVDVPKNEFLGIADLVKDIPESKIEMVEALGVPKGLIRGFMNWAAVIERAVIEDRKAMVQFGADVKPLVELAQKVKASQAGSPAGTAAPAKDAGGLQMLMGLLQHTGLVGGQAGGMSEGDRYFMEMGREMASLGSFMAKEMFRKTIPEAMAKWEAAVAAAKV